jgi:hypothetical protein
MSYAVTVETSGGIYSWPLPHKEVGRLHSHLLVCVHHHWRGSTVQRSRRLQRFLVTFQFLGEVPGIGGQTSSLGSVVIAAYTTTELFLFWSSNKRSFDWSIDATHHC